LIMDLCNGMRQMHTFRNEPINNPNKKNIIIIKNPLFGDISSWHDLNG